ncbi:MULTISPECIES: SRPBCC family protein [unclassified Streptomyces]|uniref:SRPBCC family protein n=1 Tax=unclassified Streptomyces TaxID=2593676 RepID=UPI0015876DBA|nr:MULTISPECIES: SRPBCC family protein [unclassified Streptomyces]NUV72371.1 SRPBCC family protein [Streptomyces sp. CAI-121]NUV99083.1 SRPBCC family protein [Streptomyces sp. CAI 127]NUW18364.1 SRPBCC family protein [Streptomyces sp. CAI-68]
MVKSDRTEPEEAQESGLDRLKDELSKYANAQVQKIAEKAGDKLTDITGQLSDVAENGGSLPAIGSRVLQGESPLKAFVSEKAKGAKDTVVDKAKEALGGGGKGKRKSSGSKVMNIIEVLDVGVPLRTAYDAWTQYEEFSSFAKGVRDVSKSDETESDWKVKVGPSSRSFKATVLEQVPDDRIVWSSEGAKGTTSGAVSFHELGPTLTRIILVVEYYPSGFFEKTGNLWRAQGRRMRLDFKHFQRYVTLTEEEPEGWRGEIRDGEVVVSHEEAVEREEAEEQEREDEEPEDGEDEEYEDGAEDDGEEEDEDEGEPEDEYEEDEEEEPEPEEDEEEEEEEEPPAPRRRRRRAKESR